MVEKYEQIEGILHSFREVNRAVACLIREEADELDATVVQIMVLWILKKHPNIGLGELADHLQVTNSTMSGVVDRLVEAGLIVRERSDLDRRTVTMRLTPEGDKKQNEAFGENSLLTKRLFRILEVADEDLMHLLHTHTQLLEKLKGKGDEIKDGERAV